MKNLIYKIAGSLSLEDPSRSRKVFNNIVLSFGFNFFNFIFNLLTVRLTLDYLGKAEYGIWLTLSSILTWFGYLDFGLGNGLRNKLTEALTNDNLKLAKIYISTAYALFSSFVVCLFVIFICVYGFINWPAVFQTPPSLSDTVNKLVFLVFLFFLLQFVLRLITSVTTADQKPAINGLFSFLSNFLIVAFIYYLTKARSSSIVYLGAGSTIIPMIVFFTASIILFSKSYRNIAPSLRAIKLKYTKDLLGLGFKFFVIQIAGLIVFATDNLIITQLFGPQQVTVYNIAYKYFNYVPIMFFVILTPLWSAYTEAYINKDFVWIKKTVHRIIKIWFIISALVIVMVLIANGVYKVWLHSQIEVPSTLTILMGVFVLVTNWNNVFVYFINGVGKIMIQFYYAIFIAIINIPLSVFLAKNLNMGISGVIAATILCLITTSIWAPIQYHKIVNKKATGLWAK